MLDGSDFYVLEDQMTTGVDSEGRTQSQSGRRMRRYCATAHLHTFYKYPYTAALLLDVTWTVPARKCNYEKGIYVSYVYAVQTHVDTYRKTVLIQ